MIDKRTCADCKHHKCTTPCRSKDIKKVFCDGKCTLGNRKMKCSKFICDDFEQFIWG